MNSLTNDKYATLDCKITTKELISMLNLIVITLPILAAVTWVVFNIQGPAREQWNRQFDDNSPF
tara:strand:- start:3111 stop:3302 length:192 start_codon:yes stop_codon:yes gene_type:complete